MTDKPDLSSADGRSRAQGETPVEQDVVCEHGTAMDVHCCNCHSGFIFERGHECPTAPACSQEPWKCGAKANPEDCDYPLCGCDPKADRIVAALQELGWHDPSHCDNLPIVSPPPAPAAVVAEAERLLKDITPGEWEDGYAEHDGDAVCAGDVLVAGGMTPVNAAFVAAAPRLVSELIRALLASPPAVAAAAAVVAEADRNRRALDVLYKHSFRGEFPTQYAIIEAALLAFPRPRP